jgi:hypothetical protein
MRPTVFMMARSSEYGSKRVFTCSRYFRIDPATVIRVKMLAVTERGSMVD